MPKFKPGQSGNPGGRPKVPEDIKQLARTHTIAAIQRLAFWMQSDNAKASVAACLGLLDRGWGRPSQALTGEDGGPITAQTIVKHIYEEVPK